MEKRYTSILLDNGRRVRIPLTETVKHHRLCKKRSDEDSLRTMPNMAVAVVEVVNLKVGVNVLLLGTPFSNCSCFNNGNCLVAARREAWVTWILEDRLHSWELLRFV